MAQIGGRPRSIALLILFGVLVAESADSVMKLSLTPWSHAQCSSINETTMAVACVDGSGSVAFGPDPATAWHATLTGAEYVRLGVSSGVGGGFDNSSNDLAVAFRFSPLDRKHTEKLRHHLRVYEQEVKFKLTTNVKATETLERSAKQTLEFIEQGWRTVEKIPEDVKVVFRLEQSPGFVASPLPRPAGVFFGEKGASDHLNRPNAITVHNETAFIVDTDNHRVLRVRPGDKKADVFFGSGEEGIGLGELNYPSGITFHNETAYIVDTGNHRVLRLRPGDKKAEIFFGSGDYGSGLGELQYPSGITFHNETAYIVDTGNHRVLRLRPGDKKADVFFGSGEAGIGLGELSRPTGMTFHNETAYIVDGDCHRVLRVRPGDKMGEVFFGSGEEGAPSDMTFHNETAYIVDKYNGRVWRLRPGDKKAEIFFGGDCGSGLGELKSPSGITFHNETAYIVDTGNHRVLRLRPGDKQAKVFLGSGEAGTGFGELKSPSGITFHNETAYIVDTGNHRVLRLRPGDKQAKVFFGSGEAGTGLGELSRPSGITFHNETAYIVDGDNNWVLRVRPGDKMGEVLFGGGEEGTGLGELNYPSGMTFHNETAYIVDRYNHRVLRVRPGDKKGEVFFGSGKVGIGLFELNFPTGITFHNETAYIVDSGNHRVLRLRPGETKADVFFGSGEQGIGLGELNNPSGMTFHNETAYIVDTDNHRVLRVRPGDKKGEVFSIGLGELSHPTGMTFHNETAYIVDSDNHRILQIVSPSATVGDAALGSDLAGCLRATLHQSDGTLIVVPDGPSCSPKIATDLAEHLSSQALPLISLLPSEDAWTSVAISISNDTTLLPDADVIARRKRHFMALILGVGAAAAASAAWGSQGSFLGMALAGAAAIAVGARQGAVEVPTWRGQGGSPWTSFVAVSLSIGVPWLVVPACIKSEAINQWSISVVDASCSLGIRWELHLFALLTAIIAVSGWQLLAARFSGAKVGPDDGSAGDRSRGAEEAPMLGSGSPEAGPARRFPPPLGFLEVPQEPEFLLPEGLRKTLPRGLPANLPKPLVVSRLALLFGWLYGAFFDQYGDLNSYIITESCGFKYADKQLGVLLLGFALQHVGGALVVGLVEQHSSLGGRLSKTFICLIFAPPMEAFGLKTAGNYLTTVRVLFEDVPQLVFQALFTYLVRWDKFIVFNIAMTGGMLAFNVYQVLAGLAAYTKGAK